MGAILTTLERLLERQPRRKAETTPAQPAPYPDASKAVEHFQLRLAKRVQACRNHHAAGWERSTSR
jgi:hypothetical protein